MPLFVTQFYRSMMDEDSRLLHLIYPLQLLSLSNDAARQPYC